MAELDDLVAARANIAARLREITATPKPSYSIDGQTFSWTEYFEALARQYRSLGELAGAQDEYFEQTQLFT